jgi:hypothetical protein
MTASMAFVAFWRGATRGSPVVALLVKLLVTVHPPLQVQLCRPTMQVWEDRQRLPRNRAAQGGGAARPHIDQAARLQSTRCT